MAKTVDLTVKLLEQIRDEIRTTRTDLAARLDGTNARVDGLSERLDGTNGRLDGLERRRTESELRVATELVALSGAVRDVKDLLRERLDDRDRIDDHEKRLQALERVKH